VLLVSFSLMRSLPVCLVFNAATGALIFWLINSNPAAIAILIISSYIAAIVYSWRSAPARTGDNLYIWNPAMMLRLPAGQSQQWYKSIWFWWLVNLTIFLVIYLKFR